MNFIQQWYLLKYLRTLAAFERYQLFCFPGLPQYSQFLKSTIILGRHRIKRSARERPWKRSDRNNSEKKKHEPKKSTEKKSTKKRETEPKKRNEKRKEKNKDKKDKSDDDDDDVLDDDVETTGY